MSGVPYIFFYYQLEYCVRRHWNKSIKFNCIKDVHYHYSQTHSFTKINKFFFLKFSVFGNTFTGIFFLLLCKTSHLIHFCNQKTQNPHTFSANHLSFRKFKHIRFKFKAPVLPWGFPQETLALKFSEIAEAVALCGMRTKRRPPNDLACSRAC